MSKGKSKINIAGIAFKALQAVGGGVAGNRVSDALETTLPKDYGKYAPYITAVAGCVGGAMLPKYEAIFLGMTAFLVAQ